MSARQSAGALAVFVAVCGVGGVLVVALHLAFTFVGGLG